MALPRLRHFQSPLAPHVHLFPGQHQPEHCPPARTWFSYPDDEWLNYCRFTFAQGAFRSLSVTARDGWISVTTFSARDLTLGDLLLVLGAPDRAHVYRIGYSVWWGKSYAVGTHDGYLTARSRVFTISLK